MSCVNGKIDMINVLNTLNPEQRVAMAYFVNKVIDILATTYDFVPNPEIIERAYSKGAIA